MKQDLTKEYLEQQITALRNYKHDSRNEKFK